ncbi:hypothetical protein [Parasphingopyxis marina]|uniref:Uncharacterized protein n=1 Tax=Parasphingopyxis marina TaxID=2761622 RepID=A0A842I3M5_9SPHN|nr:hypothetical protein [Parasphingopyxis marina]MBC2778644.1 hypothetical protein [Parasphingopyxis marina]
MDDGFESANSSAAGRYQFIRSTFINVYRAAYLAVDPSDDEIWALRLDVSVQERLMDHSLDQYERALGRAGLPVTSGNLYLIHFFGQRTATHLLRADRDSPLADHVSEKVLAVNPFLGGKTVGEAVEDIRGRVGDRTPFA